MQQRNTAIDFAKYIASLMVAAIHVGLFADVNDTLYFLTVHIVCRVAVPFFAVCTGYFLARHLVFRDRLEKTESNRNVVATQWKKLITLYVLWTIAYQFYSVPGWIETGWFSVFAFVDYGIAAITQGSHYHFWYLWGMIYTLPVFYLLLRFVSIRGLKASVVILWAAKVTVYAYGAFLPEPLCGMIELFGKANTFLTILPLLLLGTIIAMETERPARNCGLGFCVSFLLLAAEAWILRSCGQNAVSYIIFTLPTAYCLFHLVLHARIPLPASVTKNLGASSTFIYCVHPMLVETTDAIFTNSVTHLIFVTAGSTALGLLAVYAKKKLLGKKAALCSI